MLDTYIISATGNIQAVIVIEVLTVPLESVSDDVEGASSDKRLLVLSLVKLTNRRSLKIYESGK